MRDPGTLLEVSTALGGLAAIAVSAAAFWSNPQRVVARLFLSLSIHVTVWLLCVQNIFTAADGLPFIRLASAIGGLIPLHLWLIMDAIAGKLMSPAWRRNAWAAIGATAGFMLLVPFTGWFVPPWSTPEAPVYGVGYYAFLGTLVGTMVAVVWIATAQVRRLQGAQRLELQVLLMGTGATGAAVAITIAIAAFTRNAAITRAIPFVVLGFYTTTAWLMTTTRIFDARYLIRFSIEKLATVAAASVVVWGVVEVAGHALPSPVVHVLAVALGLWTAAVVGPHLAQAMEQNPGRTRARQTAFEIARQETDPKVLEEGFLNVLRGWARTDVAAIFVLRRDTSNEADPEFSADSRPYLALQHLRWATPERLSRQRLDASEQMLAECMRTRKMGAMVASSSGADGVVLAVGVPVSRRPITYPEILQLQELAAIIESAFARVRLSQKARESEQLAIVGTMAAGLAHEIRNPLVSIKLFVQLLPQRYGEPRFREHFLKLMSSEVDRIERLTEGMMELAHPRKYDLIEIPLHAHLEECLALVQTRADNKGVTLQRDLAAWPDVVFTDAAAVRQIVLNLGFNAIQAVEERAGERWVRVATRRTGDQVELTVTDNGPGIAPELRKKLFQPFQTTKSSGFGLGLAMCRDIVGRIHASISVDPPVPGEGATFRVMFPCRQPSS